jgi:adenosylhomocysteine nucleosidase
MRKIGLIFIAGLMFAAACAAAAQGPGNRGPGERDDRGRRDREWREDSATTPTTCIIVPGGEWRGALEPAMENLRDVRIMGHRFSMGEIGGRRVVVGISSFGKVNAAVVTALMIEHFRPEQVIGIDQGSTLNMNLELGDIAVCTMATQHDRRNVLWNSQQMIGSSSPLDGTELKANLEADAELVELALKAAGRVKLRPVNRPVQTAPRALKATLASGDQIIQSSTERIWLYEFSERDVLDQEGAAIAQVCEIYRRPLGVKWVLLRGLTDRSNRDIERDADLYYNPNMENLARIAVEMARMIARADAEDGAPPNPPESNE